MKVPYARRALSIKLREIDTEIKGVFQKPGIDSTVRFSCLYAKGLALAQRPKLTGEITVTLELYCIYKGLTRRSVTTTIRRCRGLRTKRAYLLKNVPAGTIRLENHTHLLFNRSNCLYSSVNCSYCQLIKKSLSSKQALSFGYTTRPTRLGYSWKKDLKMKFKPTHSSLTPH